MIFKTPCKTFVGPLILVSLSKKKEANGDNAFHTTWLVRCCANRRLNSFADSSLREPKSGSSTARVMLFQPAGPGAVPTFTWHVKQITLYAAGGSLGNRIGPYLVTNGTLRFLTFEKKNTWNSDELRILFIGHKEDFDKFQKTIHKIHWNRQHSRRIASLHKQILTAHAVAIEGGNGIVVLVKLGANLGSNPWTTTTTEKVQDGTGHSFNRVGKALSLSLRHIPARQKARTLPVHRNFPETPSVLDASNQVRERERKSKFTFWQMTSKMQILMI